MGPGVQGKIGMLNDVRETMGAALYRLGYSINTTSKDQLDEAEAALKEQKPLLRLRLDAEQTVCPKRRPSARARLLGDAYLARD